MPPAEVAVVCSMRTTRPVACTSSLEPGRRSFSSTFSSSGIGSSVSTKMPPSLMLRVKSENNASTVAYSIRTTTGARSVRRLSTAVLVSDLERSAIGHPIVWPAALLERTLAARGALSPRQPLELAFAAQTHPAALSDHHVVEQRHAEQRAGLNQAAGHLAVLVARPGVAARMVVDHHESGRALAQRGPEHLAWVHEACGERPPRRHDLAEHAVPAVEEQQVELLVRHVAQAGVEVAEDVLGAADRVAVLEPALGEPARHLERSDQAGRLGGAHAWVAFELARQRAGEPVEAARAEQLAGERVRRPAARSGAQQQREQLHVVERFRALRAKALARTRPFLGSRHADSWAGPGASGRLGAGGASGAAGFAAFGRADRVGERLRRQLGCDEA